MAGLELSLKATDEQSLQDASRSRINHDPKEGSSRIRPLESRIDHDPKEGGSRIRPLERMPPMRSVRGGGGSGGDGTDVLSAAATLFDPSAYHVAESAATELTSVLGMHGINSVGPQGNNDDDVTLIIDDPPAPEDVHVPTPVPIARLSRALIGGSVLTVAMVIATALYKPARGVVFGRHTAMYYLILAGILLWGVANALIGIWLARSRRISNRRFSFAKVVLVLALIPLCAILGIGGFAFTQS